KPRRSGESSLGERQGAGSILVIPVCAGPHERRCSMNVREPRGFTLIELLVVIAIIAILAAILFPVFAQARDKARGAACHSNAKQQALAIHMYAQDYDETLPLIYYGEWNKGGPKGHYPWLKVLVPYVKNKAVYTCPSLL